MKPFKGFGWGAFLGGMALLFATSGASACPWEKGEHQAKAGSEQKNCAEHTQAAAAVHAKKHSRKPASVAEGQKAPVSLTQLRYDPVVTNPGWQLDSRAEAPADKDVRVLPSSAWVFRSATSDRAQPLKKY